MAKKNTISGALPNAGGGATVTGAAGVAALAKRINDDRVKRRMTWPVYADFMGVKMATLYKIATGVTTRPHAITMAIIEEKMAQPATTTPTPAEGAADAVVSGGQRHPERSEN
jgi:hypothetical protein